MNRSNIIAGIVIFIAIIGAIGTSYNMGISTGINSQSNIYNTQISTLEVEYQILQDRMEVEVFDAFDSGYELASSTINILNQTLKTYEEAYQVGYEDALKSRLTSYGTGWNSGKDYGYNSGYTDGYDEGLQGSDLELFEMAYNSGYNEASEYWSYTSDDISENSYYNGFNDGYQTALQGDAFALGEYTMTFRDFNTTFDSYTYTTGSGDIKMLIREGEDYKELHRAPWGFIGEMNTICVIDFYDPDGNLIGVGALFGEDLTLNMSPLTKP